MCNIPFLEEHTCQVDRALSDGGMYFDVFVILATFAILFVFSKKNKDYLKHYFAVMMGVVMFEVFTSPMWNNPHFGEFAYLYEDVSWILTLGWSSLILSVVLITDHYFKRVSEIKKFLIYMILMSILGFVGEYTVLSLGLRSYSKEVLDMLSGISIGIVPVETLYYIPVFSALIIAFYKYWSFILNGKEPKGKKKIPLRKTFFLTLIAVVFFELIVEPMVVNQSLPQWSYIYKDISVIMTSIWILMIWLGTGIVDRYFSKQNLKQKFGLCILFSSLFAIPLEYFYYSAGYRVYGESAIADFIGINLPWSELPIEILFAMPMYFALMIAFVKYGELNFTKK